MAILFQTGFDHYDSILTRFNTTTGSPGFTFGSFGRNSTNGARVIITNTGTVIARRSLPSSINTIYYGFAYRTSVLPDADSQAVQIAAIEDSGTAQCTLHLLTNGKLQVRRGGTTLGETSLALLAGVFYYIDWKLVIHSSAGSTIVRINESTSLTLTSVNTQNTANNTCNDIVMSVNYAGSVSSSRTHDFDDLVVRDDTFVGDVSVVSFFPTAVGFTNSWIATGAATTALATDEVIPNSDTDYASTSIVDDATLFTFDSLPTTSIIHGVCPLPFAKKTDIGTAQLASIIRHSSTTYTGATVSPSTDYLYLPETYITNPGTGVTFTVGDWNSIQVGVKRVS